MLQIRLFYRKVHEYIYFYIYATPLTISPYYFVTILTVIRFVDHNEGSIITINDFTYKLFYILRGIHSMMILLKVQNQDTFELNLSPAPPDPAPTSLPTSLLLRFTGLKVNKSFKHSLNLRKRAKSYQTFSTLRDLSYKTKPLPFFKGQGFYVTDKSYFPVINVHSYINRLVSHECYINSF